eukprot:6593209-Prymnesium_polylepis.1
MAGNLLVVGRLDGHANLVCLNDGTSSTTYAAPTTAVIIRCVTLNTNASMIAMAGERLSEGGSSGIQKKDQGLLCLYVCSNKRLVGEWSSPKVIWCCQFTRDGEMLAAGGFDMQVCLYDVKMATLLQVIRFAPHRGPAFVWSVMTSAGGEHMSIGCWSCSAYVLKIQRVQLLWRRAAAKVCGPWMIEHQRRKAGNLDPKYQILRHSWQVAARDRVYSTALTSNGSRMLVGGRAKFVALYEGVDANAVTGVEPVQLWRHENEEIIYTVTMSEDGKLCCYGGRNMQAIVLDGATGNKLTQFDVEGIIWCVRVCSVNGRHKLAVGGEFPKVSVYDLHAYEKELELP